MPRAGFYAIESGKITFAKDGHWYTDGARIENEKIARFFSQHLRRTAEGKYLIDIGIERAEVEIEDTPFVVREIRGHPDRGFTIRLNDDSEEPLDLATLTTGPDNVLYCRVKGGAYAARFLRPPYYHLAPFIRQDRRRGFFYITSGGKAYAIAKTGSETAERR